ncbi:MAG: DUF962 domain-containing protein [Gammaproteobacteria bacterium]|nr:DUF962 domain-containing protein [Gammaproteobacteria bacterium]NND54844.1 DUF962 domain-containing protein [Gammaproteobacteria bacterium]
MTNKKRQFGSLREFYPYYLSEHQDPRCRQTHFIGTTFGLACLLFAVLTANLSFILLGLAGGYACAWFGHAVYEKNKPATFKYPFYSFLSDVLMYRDMWLNRL